MEDDRTVALVIFRGKLRMYFEPLQASVGFSLFFLYEIDWLKGIHLYNTAIGRFKGDFRYLHNRGNDWTENTGIMKASTVISHMTDFLHIRNYLMSYAQDMFLPNLWSNTL